MKSKQLLQETLKFETILQVIRFIFALNARERSQSHEKCHERYLSLKETGTSYKHKSISTKNFGKKSLTKSKTFKQNFERAENFDIYFSNF